MTTQVCNALVGAIPNQYKIKAQPVYWGGMKNDVKCRFVIDNASLKS